MTHSGFSESFLTTREPSSPPFLRSISKTARSPDARGTVWGLTKPVPRSRGPSRRRTRQLMPRAAMLTVSVGDTTMGSSSRTSVSVGETLGASRCGACRLAKARPYRGDCGDHRSATGVVPERPLHSRARGGAVDGAVELLVPDDASGGPPKGIIPLARRVSPRGRDPHRASPRQRRTRKRRIRTRTPMHTRRRQEQRRPKAWRR